VTWRRAADLDGDGGLSSNTVDTAQLVDGAVTADQIGAQEVNTTHLVNRTILAADLNITGSNPSGGQVLAYDSSGTGEFEWVEDTDTVEDNQNLSHVLEQGNVANRTIDMDSNNIVNVNALNIETALDASNISLGNGLQDSSGSVTVNPDTGISVSGSGVAVDWAAADALTGEGAISSFANASDLFANGNVTWRTASHLDGDGSVSENVISNTEVANSGSFTVNDLTLNGGSGTLLTVEGDAQVQGDLDVLGNITNTDVQELSVNGSLLPPSRYNDTFNLGNSSAWWKDAYLGGDIVVDGVVDGVDIDQPGTGLEVSGQALQIAQNGVGARELDDTGNFDVNSINIATALDAGNISLGNGLQDSSGDVAVQADTGISVSGSGVAVDWAEANDLYANGNVTWKSAADLDGDGSISTDAVDSDAVATGAVQNLEVANNAVNYTQLDGSGCANDEVLVSDGTDWSCVANSSLGDGDPDQNLQQVLETGNSTGGNDIDMDGGSVRSSTGEICIGDQCA
jgi:hypothetical protein